MPINYNIAIYFNRLNEDASQKAYAKRQYTNILTLDKFAEHMASHGSIFNLMSSRGAAKILLKGIKVGETTMDLTGGGGRYLYRRTKRKPL